MLVTRAAVSGVSLLSLCQAGTAERILENMRQTMEKTCDKHFQIPGTKNFALNARESSFSGFP